MSTFLVPPAKTLAIGLGANEPSPIGSPASTLIAVRPLLENIIQEWIFSSLKENVRIKALSNGINWRWSPIFETKAIGGPANQSDFLNAVLVVEGPTMNYLSPSKEASLNLLNRTLSLEKAFGRERKTSSIKWGPRSIDIDLLAWGELQIKSEMLTLPHPRIIERNFVLTPLVAVLNSKDQSLPRQLEPQEGWKE